MHGADSLTALNRLATRSEQNRGLSMVIITSGLASTTACAVSLIVPSVILYLGISCDSLI